MANGRDDRSTTALMGRCAQSLPVWGAECKFPGMPDEIQSRSGFQMIQMSDGRRVPPVAGVAATVAPLMRKASPSACAERKHAFAA